MSRLTKRTDFSALSDAQLIEQVRDGGMIAYGVLWSRHSTAALTAARSLTSSLDPEDLVSESFARVLRAIQSGHGPNAQFRPYLYTTIRNIAANWATRNREFTSDLDFEAEIEDPRFTEENTLAALDRSLTVTAFRSLPTRWQEVLWYDEIEGMKPAEIGPILGLKPTAVSMLALRAREGLRRAWIEAHISTVPEDSECRWVYTKLAAFTRRSLRRGDRERVERHLEEDSRCRVIFDEAEQVGSRLALVILPAFFGGIGAAAFQSQLREQAAVVAAARSSDPSAVGSEPKSSSPLYSGRTVTSAMATATVLAAMAAFASNAWAPPASDDTGSSSERSATVNSDSADADSSAAGQVDAGQTVEQSPPQVTPGADQEPQSEDAFDRAANGEQQHGSARIDTVAEPTVTDQANTSGQRTGAQGIISSVPTGASAAQPTVAAVAVAPQESGVDFVVDAPQITAIDTAQGRYFPVVTGTAIPGAQIRLSHGTLTLQTLVVGASGEWRSGQLAGFPVGESRLTITQTVAGVESAAVEGVVVLDAPAFSGRVGEQLPGALPMELSGLPWSTVVVRVNGGTEVAFEIGASGTVAAAIPVTAENGSTYSVIPRYQAGDRSGPDGAPWTLTVRTG